MSVLNTNSCNYKPEVKKHARIFVLLLLAPLILGVNWLLFPRPLVAQDAPTTEKKDPIDEALNFVSEDMKKDVRERIEETLEDLKNTRKELKPQLEKFMERNARVDTAEDHGFSGGQVPFQTGKKDAEGKPDPVLFPKVHPLIESEGVADSSKDDYVKGDTEAIFNKETFGECLEERQVTSGPYFEECKKRCNPGWVTYDAGSAENSCKRCVLSKRGQQECRYNQLYVSELYWPVYQTRTYPARAMGSFDPNGSYLHGKDKNSDLEFNAVRDASYDRYVTYLKHFYRHQYGKSYSESQIRAAFPEKYYTASDYTGRDLDPVGLTLLDTQPEHTLVYMTNGNRQLSRRMRPGKKDNWKGYVTEDRCFFNTLPDPNKLAVSHASYSDGHDALTFQYRHRDVNEQNEVGPTIGSAYGNAMLDEGPKVNTVRDLITEEWKQDRSKQPYSTTNSMFGQYIRMNKSYYDKGFERIGAEEVDHMQDWLYHNFFRLYHSRNKENLEDPLYAAIVSGFSFYTLAGLEEFGPNISSDSGKRRPIRWSFWAGRPGNPGGADSYTGDEDSVGPGKIFSVDKIQIVYPRIDDGEVGSHCFRPESLAKSEYFDPDENDGIAAKVGTQEFYGFRRDLYKRLLEQGIDDAHQFVREVRIAYWVKRVNCHCTVCAQDGFLGCSVLNTGDHPDDYFYGTKDIVNDDPDLYPGSNADIINATQSKKGIQVSKLERSSQPKGDFAIDPQSPFSAQQFRTVADLSIFSEVEPDFVTGRIKAQVQKVKGIEVSSRRDALGKYGGHAKEDDAAKPHDEGNGDEFEIGQQDEIGKPGKADSANDEPLGSSNQANDTPSDVNEPASQFPFLPPSLELPLLCEEGSCQARRTRYRCANGSCTIDSGSSAAGSVGSSVGGQSQTAGANQQNGNEESGSCGGGGGGEEEEKEKELLQQIAAQILGQLLGNLLGGGGQSSNSSSSSTSSSAAEVENENDSSSSTSSSAAESSTSSSGDIFGRTRGRYYGVGKRRQTAASIAKVSPRAMARLAPKLRRAYPSPSSKIVELSRFRYYKTVDNFYINHKEFRVVKDTRSSFGCLGAFCDESLREARSLRGSFRTGSPSYQICRRERASRRFLCWNELAGVRVIGQELLKSRGLTPWQRVQILSTSMGYLPQVDQRKLRAWQRKLSLLSVSKDSGIRPRYSLEELEPIDVLDSIFESTLGDASSAAELSSEEMASQAASEPEPQAICSAGSTQAQDTGEG